MSKWIFPPVRLDSLRRGAAAALWASLLTTFASAPPVLHCQTGNPLAPPEPAKTSRSKTAQPAQTPVQASQPPSFAIPVAPLGFANPSPFYLGQRNTLVSLDFLDEDRLLFTFRVPGLMHRDPTASAAGDERQIRAVVLSLPRGALLAEALWTLHDRSRYLWMLKDGHFLLRDGNEVRMGDASLELKPTLQFPGQLLGLEPDPSLHYLVAVSHEPAENKTGGELNAAAQAAVSAGNEKPDAARDFMLRIVHRDSGQVMLESRTAGYYHLAINGQGYLDSQRGRGLEWSLYLNYFTGGRTALGSVTSTCAPRFDFLSENEVLALLCDTLGGRKLQALATDGRHLWQSFAPDTAIWSQTVPAPNGSRLARESLTVAHPPDARNPLSIDDIRGQQIEVFDAADGHRALTVQAAPVFDAGGNVAFSPSGRRVAVLSGGGIQIFELPEAPAVPASTENHFGR